MTSDLMSFEERAQWKTFLWQMGRAQPRRVAVQRSVFLQLREEGLLTMHAWRAMPDGSDRMEIEAPPGVRS